DMAYLVECWPRYGKEKITFSAEDCRRSIQYECAVKGIWDDMERVRGRGAWRADDDGKSLVLHCGDVLVFPETLADPGEHDGRVYPGGPRMMRPLKASEELLPAEDPRAAAHQVYRILKTWNWKRGELDARLYLGAMMAGFLGGALDWRPSVWITGESRTGKSTLIKLRRDVMDTWSLNASNATSASIYQRVKFDAIAVSLDEQENTADSRNLDNMVKLARDAASGDLILRGGSGGTGTAFRARNSFQFASINAAALRQQDMNRMPQLELYQIEDGAEEPHWTILEARRWGQELLRRACNHWHRWDETLKAHRAELKQLGHDARGADTFGTLLALADLVLSEEGYLTGADGKNHDPDMVKVWGAILPSLLTEYTDAIPNWRACLDHLLASRPRDWKTGAPSSIGGACSNFLFRVLADNGDERLGYGAIKEEMKEKNALLAYAGCRIHRDARGFCLFIANNHPGLLEIYEKTDWKGIPGAPGPWTRAMGNAPPDLVEKIKLSVDGTQGRGLSIALEDFVDWRPEKDAGAGDDEEGDEDAPF
ncbi:MAG: hypothetical protein WA989_08680, partial [Henriciella sp.]|uniref:hypothetical protein n=1 Tax=Henriciella sp. TaxID=1968823 RepID=UPI003C783D4B